MAVVTCQQRSIAQKKNYMGNYLKSCTSEHLLYIISSVQFSRLVMSDSLQPHELRHARLPCSLTISGSLLKLMFIKSVMPSNLLILCCSLLLLPSIFPASGSFLMNQFFTSGGQSIGALDSASVLPMNNQG